MLRPTRKALEPCTATAVHVIVAEIELIRWLIHIVATAVVKGKLVAAHSAFAWRHEPLRW